MSTAATVISTFVYFTIAGVALVDVSESDVHRPCGVLQPATAYTAFSIVREGSSIIDSMIFSA